MGVPARGPRMSDQPLSHSVIPFPCPQCAAPLRVAAGLAGRRVSCPACAAPVEVPNRLPDPAATVVIRPEELEETVVIRRPAPPPT